MKVLEENGYAALVTDGKNVFTVAKPIEFYAGTETPMGARIECTLEHFERFRSVYSDRFCGIM